MVLCWNEGQGSAIHDHAKAHCVMKILEGKLCEVRFWCYSVNARIIDWWNDELNSCQLIVEF